jgi:hypothetical protein
MYQGITNQVLVKEYYNLKLLGKLSPTNADKYKLAIEVLKEIIVERGLPMPQ